MASTLRFALPVFLLLAACTGSTNSESKPSGDDTASPPTTTPITPAPTTAPTTTTTAPTTTSADAQRVIAEADIVQLVGTNLVAISDTGTLSIIDVSQRNALKLLGEVYLAGSPFEMYVQANGQLTVLLTDALGGGSTIITLDIKDPTVIQRVGSASLPGTIFDSRLAGTILYVAASDASMTDVTSFDLSAAAPMTQVDTLTFPSTSTSILFGNGRLYVGGANGIDLIDVSDAGGKLALGTHVNTQGPITERWQMSEQDAVLRTVSQGASQPVIETFQVGNARSVQPMGNAVLTLPTVEPLKSVRFDTDRAYATTFQDTDPLFVIDLKNPAQPVPRGTLTISGSLFYLEPHGDRLLGLGIDDDSTDHLNVSLFDVSDLDHPTMIQRVEFGGYDGDLPEDQNEIQKAFVANPNGLITIPITGAVGTDCTTGGGVQLVDWTQDVLTKQAFVPVAGNPRRALTSSTELVAVSDSDVTAFDITQHAAPVQTADLVVGTCAVRTSSATTPMTPIETSLGDDYGGGDDDDAGHDGILACSASRVGGNPASSAVLVGLGLVAAAVARRRRS